MVRADYEIGLVLFVGSPLLYRRMFDALLHSMDQCGGDVRVHVAETGMPDPGLYENPFFAINTRKLAIWRDMAWGAQRPIVLLDTDMLVLRPLVDAFADFEGEVGITVRPDGLLNAGAVYLRPGEAAQGFMDRWCEVNDALFEHEFELMAWQEKQPGMNQPALRKLLDQGEPVCELPCWKWNCMDSCWRDFQLGETGVLHLKGALRRCVFDGGPVPRGADMAAMVGRWFAQPGAQSFPVASANEAADEAADGGRDESLGVVSLPQEAAV